MGPPLEDHAASSARHTGYRRDSGTRFAGERRRERRSRPTPTDDTNTRGYQMTGRSPRLITTSPARWTRRLRPAPPPQRILRIRAALPRREPPVVMLGLLTLGALLLALTTCDRIKAKETAAPPAPPPPTVVVAEVVKKTVPIIAEFVAQTDAVQTVELRA